MINGYIHHGRSIVLCQIRKTILPGCEQKYFQLSKSEKELVKNEIHAIHRSIENLVLHRHARVSCICMPVSIGIEILKVFTNIARMHDLQMELSYRVDTKNFRVYGVVFCFEKNFIFFE